MDYPDKPPTMQFLSKINLPGVNKTNGMIEKLGCLDNWKRNYTLETVLSELRKYGYLTREMSSSANKKLPQPAEGSFF
jgi:ubiquitin-conjugating enzyme E2 variant